MNKFSRDLVQGMQEAAAFVEGKKVGAREHVVEVPDVRAIRQRLHMSQQRFAETYRIPLPTLKTGSRAAARRMRRPPPRNIAAGDDCGALIARRRGLLCRNRTGVGAAAAESGRPTHAIGRLDLGLGDCRHFQLSPSLERTAGLTAP